MLHLSAAYQVAEEIGHNAITTHCFIALSFKAVWLRHSEKRSPRLFNVICVAQSLFRLVSNSTAIVIRALRKRFKCLGQKPRMREKITRVLISLVEFSNAIIQWYLRLRCQSDRVCRAGQKKVQFISRTSGVFIIGQLFQQREKRVLFFA